MSHKFLPLLMAIGISTLTGCYLDKGDEESFPTYMKTGTIVDSPVSSIIYRINGGVEKRTNFQGSFGYEDGDFIRFYIGNYGFPAVIADELITPMTLAGTNDINDRRVVNIAFILQAVDSDQNPDNGIEVTDVFYGANFDFNFDQDFNDFLLSIDVDDLIQSYLDGKAPAYADVVDHLHRQLGLRGSWVSDSGAILNFLKDSAVLYTSTLGYEYGQYSFDSAEGTMIIAISDDYDGNHGFGPQTEFTITQLDMTTLILAKGETKEQFTRIEDSVLNLADAWFYLDVATGDRYLLNLFSDKSYQLTRVSTSDGGDIDRGSYEIVSGLLSLVSDDTRNTDLGIFAFDNKERKFSVLLGDRELTIKADESFTFSRQ